MNWGQGPPSGPHSLPEGCLPALQYSQRTPKAGSVSPWESLQILAWAYSLCFLPVAAGSVQKLPFKSMTVNVALVRSKKTSENKRAYSLKALKGAAESWWQTGRSGPLHPLPCSSWMAPAHPPKRTVQSRTGTLGRLRTGDPSLSSASAAF